MADAQGCMVHLLVAQPSTGVAAECIRRAPISRQKISLMHVVMEVFPQMHATGILLGRWPARKIPACFCRSKNEAVAAFLFVARDSRAICIFPVQKFYKKAAG
jgi:hypothetical protein